MCKWGTDVEVENLLTVDGGRRTWKIDACLAPIVKALNDGGIDTIQSCCGHNKWPGRIDLVDGRVLTVNDDSKTEEQSMEQDVIADPAPLATHRDLLEFAWLIIANAGGGDWTTQTAEWQEAAPRWRDQYHEYLREIQAL